MNNKGQSFVLILASLPVLLTIGFFSFQLFYCLQLQVSTHHVCRRKLAATQQELGHLLDQLLAMNSTAYTLQKVETMAKYVLRMAKISLNPEAIELATEALDAIHTRQDTFHFAQKAILMQARMLSSQTMLSIRQSSEFRNSSIGSQKMSDPDGLAVEPYPRESRSPRYKTVENFEHKQTLALSWKTQMLSHIPDKIKQTVHVDPHLYGRCSATITKERSEWKPRLNRVSL